MKLFRLIISVLIMCLGTAQVQAQGASTCVGPGSVLDVPTPGFLKNSTPNLRLRFGTTLYPANVILFTTSRLRIQLPQAGYPASTNFKVVHIQQDASQKVVASAQTCNNWGGADGPASADGQADPGGGSAVGAGTSAANGSAVAKIRNRRALAPYSPATKDDVMAPSGAPEYVFTGKSTEVVRAQVVLLNHGVTILRSFSLNSLGLRVTVVDLNGVMGLDELRALLAKSRISVTVDRHTVYAGSAAPNFDYAGRMIGYESRTGCVLRKPIRIGIVDGPIDTSHPSLQGATVFSRSVLNQLERPGSTDHATGIASIIAATPGGKQPPGLALGAQLFSVVAFSRSGARDVARLENIAEAIDWLLSRNVDIVNLSLSGPYNATLETVINIASKKGMILVAAAGNGGGDKISYPAANPNVFAITAVDAAKHLYGKANVGEQLDFAAPGVDLIVAGRRGVSFKSGTSYATAVATAVIARELAKGRSTKSAIMKVLRDGSEDLGQAGHDPLFGWGLIKSPGC